MRRRFLPLVLAAVFAVPGCVSVTPQATTHPQAPALAPAALRTAPAPTAEESAALAPDDAQPSARSALVDTGPRSPQTRHDRHEEPRRAEHPAVPEPRRHRDRPRAAVPPPPHRRQAARPEPRPRHRAHPQHRTQPQHRTPRTGPGSGYDMRPLCRAAADHSVNSGIVTLCRNSYG
ncbi:hypothetical protein [Streptomyces sp. NPDC002276]